MVSVGYGFCVRTGKSHPYMCLLNPPSVMYINITSFDHPIALCIF